MKKLPWLLSLFLILQIPYVYGMDDNKTSQQKLQCPKNASKRRQSIPESLKNILVNVQIATHNRFTRLQSPEPTQSPPPTTKDHLAQCDANDAKMTETNE